MPFISESLDDVTEPKAAPEAEYDLTIFKVEEKESKSGNPMAEVFIRFDDPSIDAFPIRHYVMKWDHDTPADQVISRKREYKRFCACFHLAEDSEAEDWVGNSGRCLVIQEEGNDNNTYNRLRLPKLR